MNIMKGVSPLTRGLALACLGLAATVVVQVLYPVTLPTVGTDPGAAADIDPVTALPAYVPPSFDTFAEVLERPLFFADRQLPPVPVVETQAAAPREPLGLTLEGVALTSTSRVALLRDPRGDSLVTVAEGGSHNGWTLESVSSSGARFRRDDDVTELELEVQTNRRLR